MRSGRFGPSLLGVEAAMVGQKEQAASGECRWCVSGSGGGGGRVHGLAHAVGTVWTVAAGSGSGDGGAAGQGAVSFCSGMAGGGIVAWHMRSGRFGPFLLGVEGAMVGQQGKEQSFAYDAPFPPHFLSPFPSFTPPHNPLRSFRCSRSSSRHGRVFGGGGGAVGGACEATAGAEEYSEVEEVQWAVRVVRHWQEVKAAALGPSHWVDRLGEILEGPMLELWRNRAKEVENNGWFWVYSFLSLNGPMLELWRNRAKEVENNGWFWSGSGDGSSEQVSKEGCGGSSGAVGSTAGGCSGPDPWPSHPRSLVPFLPSSLSALPQVEMAAVSKCQKKAVVEAVVQEAARLVDAADPTHNDAYRSTYTARYELLQTGTCWKIVGGTVLR
ncbi:unnamed protein product [Closterium sp. Naga37s-1]|nr:unnamed protein product [Closterium sp. Naga37s-1]